MAAIATAPAAAQAPAPARQAQSRRYPVWRWVILLLAGAYFLIPLYAALRFAGVKAFPDIFESGFFSAIPGCPCRLAVITTIITLVLMVPTTVYVHLRPARMVHGGWMEAITTILPIVIPPIVLIIGVLKVAPSFLLGTPYLLALVYVILAMPFAYRSLDAGLRAFDLRTMVEASNSLGAGWPSTLWRVVLPNIRTAIMSATVLTVALVLGEFTMASLDLYVTFPVWIVQFEQGNSGPVSVAGVAARAAGDLAPADADRDHRQPRRAQARRIPGGAVQRRPAGLQPNRGGTRMTGEHCRRPAYGEGGAARGSRPAPHRPPPTSHLPSSPSLGSLSAPSSPAGAPVALTDLSRHFGAVRACPGCRWRSAPARAGGAAGPVRLRQDPAALRILASFEIADSGFGHRRPRARTSPGSRRPSGTWGWYSRATACSPT